jgi:hypothetical protein
MGKIKEAMMLQEEIIEHIEEQLGEGTAQEFNILEYCFKNDLTPQQAREQVFSFSTVELQKLVE